MRKGGQKRTPLWITEIGWPSAGHKQNPYYRTPKGQAKVLRQAFDLFLERRWGIKRVYWYTWRDNNVNPACDVCRFSGLLEADGVPKPAWYRYVKYSGGSPGD
jgi:exo-beta-1,3-glucanase (GH17 family)